MVDLERAGEFLWRHARLVERRRFAHHFVEPDPDGVVDALLSYRCADGGFGWALEPDCRTPFPQPEATHLALSLLEEAGRLHDVDLAPTVEWLASVATPEGGVPFCLETVRGYPRAPWWEPEGDPPPANINPTAGIVGLLRSAGVSHPWLDTAEAYCAEKIDGIEMPNHYEAHNIAEFCAGTARSMQRLIEQLRSGRVVALDPAKLEGSDPHTPLMIAPTPNHPCAAAFDDATMQAFLDHLESLQADDGGWPITWPAPGETAVAEWRGIRTLDALRTLRAYGRVSG